MYQTPKLSLIFNPPITTEGEYWRVIDLLNMVYPNLLWNCGKSVTESDMSKINAVFHGFFIGADHPDRLTYTSRPNRIDDEYDVPDQDGRQWIKDHTIDVEDIFNKLNESKSAENSTKGYRPKLLLSFDPPIETTESLNKVLDVLDGVYPGLTWVNHKSVLRYNAIEEEMDPDSFVGTLTIGYWEEQPDELSWGSSREGDDTYDYELYEDGWRWVQKYTPNVNDAFSKLYESENEVDYTFLRTQDVLGLRFYHPLEYEESGTVYTIVDDDGESVKVKWRGSSGDDDWIDWDGFIRDLNRGFYFIKDDDVKTTIDNFNTLFETKFTRVELNLFFDPPITNQKEWERFTSAIRSIIPDVKWAGGQHIDQFPRLRNVSVITLNLHHDDNNKLHRDSNPHPFYKQGFAPSQDGWSWIDSTLPDVEDAFNKLYESEGVRTIHVGDNVYVPSWEQIGTILDISGRNGIYKKITEIKPGECAFGVVFHIRLNETGRWVYLSRGQFEFPKMSSDDAFSKLYESEDDFEWAKQLVNVPITLGYLWERDALVKGDEIALYGEVRDSEKLLFNLTGQGFKVYQIIYKREIYSGNATGEIYSIKLEWLTSLSDRPVNWRVASTGNYFETDPSTMITDGMLRVEYITPPQEKITESEDDFDWAREILQQEPIPRSVKINNNKRFIIPNSVEFKDDWQKFEGWVKWLPVEKIDSMFGVDCYVINIGTPYGETYVPIEDFNPNEKNFMDIMKESEDDFDWVKDIAPPDSVDSDLWLIIDRGHYYPENIMLWDYFNIPGARECINGQTNKGEPTGDRKCIDDLYNKGILVIPESGDECYHDTKLWIDDTYFSNGKSLPVHHMIRVKDGGHVVMTNQGVRPIK